MATIVDVLIGELKARAAEWLRDELTSATRWEADPKTKTIRRRRPPRPRDEVVLEQCAKCGTFHQVGQCKPE